jgi:nitrate/nitrite transporter NarK
LHFALGAGLSALGCVVAVVFDSLSGAMAGLSLAIIGITCTRPMIYAMPARFLTGAAAAGGIGFINGIANIGGFVGPSAIGWLKDATGLYAAGMLALGASLVVSVALTLSLKFVINKE